MSKKKDTKAGGKRLRKPTTRRQFLQVAGIGGLSAASLYLLGCAAEEITTTETVTSTTTVTGPGVTTTVTAPGTTTTVTAAPTPEEISWDYEADVVVIGSGATGILAAIRAIDAGASAIVVEQNYDIGGRAIASGGGCVFGGGTSEQTKWGVVDSPELYFKDMTDWSIVGSHGLADYRYNDREMIERGLLEPLDNMVVAGVLSNLG